MKHCQNCKEQLDFWMVYRSFILTGYQPFTCPNCGAEYAHRPINRFLVAGSIAALLILFLFLGQSVLAGVPLIWQVLGYIFAAFLVSLALVPLLRFEVRDTSRTPKS